MESTPEGIDALIQNCLGELVEGRCIQAPAQLMADPEAFGIVNRFMDGLLTRIEQMLKKTT